MDEDLFGEGREVQELADLFTLDGEAGGFCGLALEVFLVHRMADGHVACQAVLAGAAEGRQDRDYMVARLDR